MQVSMCAILCVNPPIDTDDLWLSFSFNILKVMLLLDVACTYNVHNPTKLSNKPLNRLERPIGDLWFQFYATV